MTIQNLLTVFDQASSFERSQAAWYWTARQDCIKAAALCGVPVQWFIYAVAALSPQVYWEYNIRAIIELCQTGKTGFGYRINREKALRCLAGDLGTLKGPKVTRFALSLLNPNKYVKNEVVVDTWAYRAWANVKLEKPTLSLKVYHAIASDYREAARLVGLLPGEFQAIIWVTIQRLHDRPNQIPLDI